MPDGWDEGRRAQARAKGVPLAQTHVSAARRRMLRGLAQSERKLREVYARVARRLARARERSRPDLEARIYRELRRTINERLRLIRETVAEAAGAGQDAHIAEARAVPNPRTVALARVSTIPRTVSARILSASGAIDGVSLAARLRGIDRQTANRLATVFLDARSRGESALALARRFSRVAGRELQEQVPAYVAELAAVMRGSRSDSAVKAAIQHFRSRTMRRGSVAGSAFTIRGANKVLLSQLQRGTAADVASAVQEWVARKAAYRATVIARTETARAFRVAYQETVQRNPDVVAVQWNLSASHPQPDICDVYAASDPLGLGPGVYGPGDVVAPPAHPNCLCFLTSHLRGPDGSSPLRQGRPDRGLHTALARLPADTRRQVLGPARHAAYMRSPRSVVTTGEVPGLASAQSVRAREARRRRAKRGKKRRG